jgi:hypothetical protein
MRELLTKDLQVCFDQCRLETGGGELLAADPAHLERFKNGVGYQKVWSIILGKRQDPLRALHISGEGRYRCDGFLRAQDWLCRNLDIPVDCLTVIGTGWNGEGSRIIHYLEQQFAERWFDWTRLNLLGETQASNTTENIAHSHGILRDLLDHNGKGKGPILWVICTTDYHALRLWVLHALLHNPSQAKLDLSDLGPILHAPSWKDDDGIVFLLVPYAPATSNDSSVRYCIEVTVTSHLVAPLQKVLHYLRQHPDARKLPQRPVQLFCRMTDRLLDLVPPTRYVSPNLLFLDRVETLQASLGVAIPVFRQIENDLREAVENGVTEAWRIRKLPRILDALSRFVEKIRWISDVDLQPPLQMFTWP